MHLFVLLIMQYLIGGHDVGTAQCGKETEAEMKDREEYLLSVPCQNSRNETLWTGAREGRVASNHFFGYWDIVNI